MDRYQVRKQIVKLFDEAQKAVNRFQGTRVNNKKFFNDASTIEISGIAEKLFNEIHKDNSVNINEIREDSLKSRKSYINNQSSEENLLLGIADKCSLTFRDLSNTYLNSLYSIKDSLTKINKQVGSDTRSIMFFNLTRPFLDWSKLQTVSKVDNKVNLEDVYNQLQDLMRVGGTVLNVLREKTKSLNINDPLRESYVNCYKDFDKVKDDFYGISGSLKRESNSNEVIGEYALVDGILKEVEHFRKIENILLKENILDKIGDVVKKEPKEQFIVNKKEFTSRNKMKKILESEKKKWKSRHSLLNDKRNLKVVQYDEPIVINDETDVKTIYDKDWELVDVNDNKLKNLEDVASNKNNLMQFDDKIRDEKTVKFSDKKGSIESDPDSKLQDVLVQEHRSKSLER